MTEIEKIDKLIEKADEVIRSHRPNPPNVIGFPTLNGQLFTAWQTQCLNFLEQILPPNNAYVQKFRDGIKQAYKGTAESGKGILQSVREDLLENSISIKQDKIVEKTPIENIKIIADRFHLVAKQLRNRYDSRDTLDVNDEYDVQDLFSTLLVQFFDDVRKEEWTPSYAGKSSRMDFLLKDFDIVIEIKKTRKGLDDKELGDQLIEDIARYQSHPNCETLICFVYDPEGRISNPHGIENDLSKRNNELDIIVWIKP
jgi:hypothetical protein